MLEKPHNQAWHQSLYDESVGGKGEWSAWNDPEKDLMWRKSNSLDTNTHWLRWQGVHLCMEHFTQYCAGCRLKPTGRERRASRWSGCWVLEAQRQACDLWASWGWSKCSWTPFHWTTLHGTWPGKNRTWGERPRKKKFSLTDNYLWKRSFTQTLGQIKGGSTPVWHLLDSDSEAAYWWSKPALNGQCKTG